MENTIERVNRDGVREYLFTCCKRGEVRPEDPDEIASIMDPFGNAHIQPCFPDSGGCAHYGAD